VDDDAEPLRPTRVDRELTHTATPVARSGTKDEPRDCATEVGRILLGKPGFPTPNGSVPIGNAHLSLQNLVRSMTLTSLTETKQSGQCTSELGRPTERCTPNTKIKPSEMCMSDPQSAGKRRKLPQLRAKRPFQNKVDVSSDATMDNLCGKEFKKPSSRRRRGKPHTPNKSEVKPPKHFTLNPTIRKVKLRPMTIVERRNDAQPKFRK